MPAGCYLIDLPKLGIPCSSVVHMEFLVRKSGLPVLAILHSGITRGTTGRIVSSRFTNQLTAITISKHDVTVVWNVKKIPHDAFACIPCENGDVLVLSQNAIQRVVCGAVNQTLQVNGSQCKWLDY